MRQWKSSRVGILFALLPALVLSCGKTQPTEPPLAAGLTSIEAPERFESSAQRETRELLVDSRPTPIEWNIAGNPSFFLASGHGEGAGGEFYVTLRSVWTKDRFGNEKAFYLLLQWPDRTANLVDRPIVNDSIDIFDDNGNPLLNCLIDDRIVRPTSWHRASVREDEVTVEFFSDSIGSYPADVWRWGANTTNVVTPSSVFDFLGAAGDGDSLGMTTHPSAAFAEDFWQLAPGAPPADDVGRLCYFDNFAQYPNGYVPLTVAGKGTRDVRLNRAKPVTQSVWSYVAVPLTACTVENPIRVDDAAIADKTWNPGDYVPSYAHIFPTQSQLDVLARGGWESGKWALEIRRDLATYVDPDAPILELRADDLRLFPGRRYLIRISIRDGETGRSSRTELIPIHLKPGA